MAIASSGNQSYGTLPELGSQKAEDTTRTSTSPKKTELVRVALWSVVVFATAGCAVVLKTRSRKLAILGGPLSVQYKLDSRFVQASCSESGKSPCITARALEDVMATDNFGALPRQVGKTLKEGFGAKNDDRLIFFDDFTDGLAPDGPW